MFGSCAVVTLFPVKTNGFVSVIDRCGGGEKKGSLLASAVAPRRSPCPAGGGGAGLNTVPGGAAGACGIAGSGWGGADWG